jgi:hypothetical protein
MIRFLTSVISRWRQGREAQDEINRTCIELFGQSGRQEITREMIGDWNELACLEDMATNYARGKYENRQYIERCFNEFERRLGPL